ncbi:MAG: hypothetical protein DMF06_16480 [Verrucomicrobia bacterium]|nr:MAG: hypothetical protein DMF06_16480 [Verrucomicrobiota bacterium]
MTSNDHEEKTLRNIRWLIWLYFWLLLSEGALRKWIVPMLSSPLLIIRDPVLLLAYVLAWRAGIFPRNRWVVSLAVIGFLSLIISVVPLWPYPPTIILFISGYGFRSNFLHLPLIFLIPAVMRGEDVKKIGWWVLVLLVPMTLLMIAQFEAGPESILNRTASGEGEMITAGSGKVRTSGTFSFIIGVVAYYSAATGFLIWAAQKHGVYKKWLLIVAAIAVVIGIAVSGSRSTVAACALVIASLLVVFILRPGAVTRLGQALLAIVFLGYILFQIPLVKNSRFVVAFNEGVTVLTERFTAVAETEERSITSGMVTRVVGSFSNGIFILGEAPWLGFGLGIGTNAAAKFLTGESSFLLSEEEWSRIFLESGPVLGLAFVLWRCGLALKIGFLCLKSVRGGNTLPLLLFSSSFFPLVIGQLGQPTVLGFTVLVTGLALAARDEAEENLLSGAAPQRSHLTKRVVGRRSPYADRLHRSVAPRDENNGSSNR